MNADDFIGATEAEKVELEKLQNEALNAILEKYAKLNELKPDQVEVLKEAISYTVLIGTNTGFARGVVAQNELHHNTDMIASPVRTFFSAAGCIAIMGLLAKHFDNPLWVVALAAPFLTTALFFAIDMGAEGIKRLVVSYTMRKLGAKQ